MSQILQTLEPKQYEILYRERVPIGKRSSFMTPLQKFSIKANNEGHARLLFNRALEGKEILDVSIHEKKK